MANFDLNEATAILIRTPIALNGLLRGLPDTWVRENEGESTWSAFDIVGHLEVAERTDWMPRVLTLLEHGETQPFPPFDRFAQLQENSAKTMEQVLDEFATSRRESLAALDALRLQAEDLNRCGHHPAFGSVKLSQLLACWTAHDLNHLHQLARVMAHQYREAVGPWSAYLGVLHCNGHSA